MKQKIINFGGPRRRVAPTRAQAKAAAGVRRKRRRTGRHTLHYILIILVALAVIAILSLTVFFGIEKISVTGTTKYAAQEIIEAAGIKVGDNLFRVSEGAVSRKLVEKFPYVQSVKIKRAFPPSLTIQVTQEKPLGAVNTATGYVVIGQSGRVLEIGAQTVPDGITVVSGMYLYHPQLGKILGTGYKKEEAAEAEKEANALKSLKYLVDAVMKTSFDQITLVDFSDELNMMIVYDNRLMIELGTEMKLANKLERAQTVIEDYLDSEFQGILDVSMDKKAWTKPADIQQEIEKRRLIVREEADAETPGPPTSNNPELAVIPGTAPSSSSQDASSGGADGSSAQSGSDAAASSEAASSRNELETIPGTGPVSSSAVPPDAPAP